MPCAQQETQRTRTGHAAVKVNRFSPKLTRNVHAKRWQTAEPSATPTENTSIIRPPRKESYHPKRKRPATTHGMRHHRRRQEQRNKRAPLVKRRTPDPLSPSPKGPSKKGPLPTHKTTNCTRHAGKRKDLSNPSPLKPGGNTKPLEPGPNVEPPKLTE